MQEYNNSEYFFENFKGGSGSSDTLRYSNYKIKKIEYSSVSRYALVI